MLIPDLLDHGLSRAPDRACVIQGGTRRSFAQVDDRAARAATAMTAAGVGPGDRVVLLAANEPEFLELHVACQRAEAVLVAVNYRLAPAELAAIVADATPRLLIHGPGFADPAATLAVATTWHLGADGTGDSYEQLLGRSAPTPRGAGLDSAALAQIMYTSGTTGLPKGAQISNGALFGRLAVLTAALSIGERDVFLQTLPLFHLASLASFAFTACAATCVTVRDFDPAAVLGTVEREQITHTLVVPTIIEALLGAEPSFDGDLASLHTMFYGASPIAAGLLIRALDTFGCRFAQLYGMTEAGIAVSLEPADHDPVARQDLLAAAGRDLPFCRVGIVRADGSPAAAGEVGEIVLAGPGLMTGYWNAPTATAEVLREGWMHTGDAGYRTEAGYLFVTDRIKDMIITGGENVFCGEVEAVLSRHPTVTDVAVIGLPDPRWGQRVHALIVGPQGGTGGVDTDELDAWCREHLAGYKRPRSYEAIDALPRNAVGKVLKRILSRDRQTE